MDHKRGYNLLDQADHEARKRQKDLSHPSSTPPFRDFMEVSPRINNTNRGSSNSNSNNNNNNLWLLGANKSEANLPSKTANEMDQTVEESSYKRMLPLLRKELEHERDVEMAESRRGVRRRNTTFEKDEKTCALCPNNITFKGTDALLIHAAKYTKDRPQQHRGYFRALKEALKEHEELQMENLKAQQRQQQQQLTDQPGNIRPALGYPKGKGGRTDTNLTGGGVEARLEWKPNILIVENNKLSEVERIICPEEEHRVASDGRHACVPHERSRRPRLKEVLAVYSTGDSDHDKRNVFVFPATEVGYIHDKVLKDTCRLEHGGQHMELGFHCNDHRELVDKLQGGHAQEQGDMFALTLKRWGDVKNLSGLKLLPEEELVYDQQLFDNSKFNKITKIVTRWSNNFKAVDRKFEVQRSFHEDNKMHEVAEVWQEDLRRINGYQPAIKKKVKEQMVAIEDKLRSDRLIWLQEVEAVREQFQRMAHNIKEEEEAANLRNTRWEQQNMKRQEKKEYERMCRDNLEQMRRTNYYTNIKKYKRSTEGRLLMETWSEEYDKLKWESCKAKDERIRLQNIHEKVHQKALESRKGKCPICFEQLRRDFAKDSNEPFSQFYPVSKLCLNLTCPKRH